MTVSIADLKNLSHTAKDIPKRNIICVLMSVLSGCYLTSQKPTGKLLNVSEQDRQISSKINEVMTESGNILRDIHRLTAFSLGSSIPKGAPAQTGTDLPQYLTLFDSIEVESLDWQTKDPKRFSRYIWNESVYLMQRENPDFKFRVEGKVPEKAADPELIVFVLDT